MKTLSLSVFLFFANLALAQVTDNFDDSDLLANPQWGGQLDMFNTQGKELNSNSNTANSTFYISVPSTVSVNAEWHIDTKLLFNPSSTNYVDLVVMSDSSNVFNMKNGYFIRLGGTPDEISLYKTKDGINTLIIDGADKVLNSSNNQWQIILKRKYSGNFILQRQLIAGGPLITEGITNDSDIIASGYFGIRIRQSTASFFNKHYFDNLFAGKIIKDTVPPVWDSLVLMDNKQLVCTFNEVCDSLSLLDTINYQVIEGNIGPESVTVMGRNRVVLNFRDAFQPNRYLNLKVQNIRDTTGNIMITDTQSFYYSKPDTASIRGLLITELMPDPEPAVGLPNQEYIEITNVSGRFIQLKGCKIHDPTGERNLPDKILAPDSIIVLTSIPPLNNAGDKVWLTNQMGEIIHNVSYTDGWYKDDVKKNGGWSLEMISENNVCAGGSNWSASIHPDGGTPGFVNSVKGISSPDTRAPQITSIIPLNDSILQLVFDEEIDSINSLKTIFIVNGVKKNFKLKEMSGDFYTCTWLIDFKPDTDSIYQVIFSGIKDCSNNAIAGKEFKLQWPSESKKSDLVFNEILFNPKTGGYDFIELYNNTSHVFDLGKFFIAVMDETNQYKSIDKLSETPLFISPQQYILISANTAKVCKQYNCKNAGALQLNFNKMPSMPDDAGNLLLINAGGTTVDSLVYSEDWHFPLLSDKEGVSLERISFIAPTTSADNWHSAASIVGFATPGYLNSQSSATTQAGKYFILQSKTVSPDEDGYEDVLILNYHLPKQDYVTSITIYDTEGRLIKQWVNNETLGTEGFVTWNGTDYNTQKAAIGMYILAIECTHPDGDKIRQKIGFTVAGKF